MRTLRLVPVAVLVVLAGCAEDRDTGNPMAPTLAGQRASAGPVEASGHFAALVDFTSLTLTPRGRNCLLEVDGQLVFTGTIEGVATGRTSALVFGPCATVAITPPGTFRDVFKSELEFKGTVDGQAACANLLYMGRVEQGGAIDGRLVFSKGSAGRTCLPGTEGIAGRLEADARVAVGGEYRGSVVVK
jgi:hypothetical protein